MKCGSWLGCDKDATRVYKSEKYGMRQYRCEDHTELDGPAFGHRWERVSDEELVMEIIDS